MAELGAAKLIFDRSCPDPGRREIDLPVPLPEIGDDFDWNLGDYDSYRDAMLDELARRYPERRWWTSADLEVVLLEVFAAVLDQLSDMADRVAAESYLETARRPETVLAWLSFIGAELEELAFESELDLESVLTSENTSRDGGSSGDAASGGDEDNDGLSDRELMTNAILEKWRADPPVMESIRLAEPGNIRTQKRMSSLRDYELRLEEHPLVLRAQANRLWGGSWPVVWITVSLWNNMLLADSIGGPESGRPVISGATKEDTDRFHEKRKLRPPDWEAADTLSDVLDKYLIRYRSIGQEVLLVDVDPVGIDLSFCLTIQPNYFQSEVLREARRVLGRGPGGFFEPGRLKFGEDLHVSDFYQRLMGLDGIDTVDALIFKKVGNRYPNRAAEGLVALSPQEVAVCDDDYFRRERGTLKITMRGGRRG